MAKHDKSTAQRRIERAKKLHRPSFSLHDWSKDYLYGNFHIYRDALDDFSSFIVDAEKEEVSKSSSPSDSVVRRISYDEFEKLEMLTEPALISDVPFRDNWSAVENWPKLLESDSHRTHPFRRRMFKCGEDDDGRKIKVRMKHFLSYMKKNRDDSPLYIFDANFDTDRVCKSILNDYKVPSLFRDDLFNLISEQRRPPFRWFLVGPERSGTTLHIDPLSTAAWNTLIYGKKRWVLFPPHTPKKLAKAASFCHKGEDDEASQYFMVMLTRLRRQARKAPKHYPNLKIFEFTQNAGETVFIPNGWWHAVLNLTDTVGVTQNFVSERVGNFDEAWLKTRTGRKRMAWKWLLKLRESHPHLADRALELNERDNFKMKYDPANDNTNVVSSSRSSGRETKRARTAKSRNAASP